MNQKTRHFSDKKRRFFTKTHRVLSSSNTYYTYQTYYTYRTYPHA